MLQNRDAGPPSYAPSDNASDNLIREHYIEEIDKAMKHIHKLGLKIKELPVRKSSRR